MALLTGTGGPFAFTYYGPRLQLSPRIRGMSDSDHFDSSNGLRSTLYAVDLAPTTEDPNDDVKGPTTLVFVHPSGSYKVPLSLANLVGPGYNNQVVWRFTDIGTIGVFRYYKEAPGVN